MPDRPEGKILTFYSYKGGTGRTMALANVACVLASKGHRVLVVDWDLEAPGLHRYFHPFLRDKRLVNTKGMIDMVFDFQKIVLALPPSEGPRHFPDAWYDQQVNIIPYTAELAFPHPLVENARPLAGEIHLLGAGQQSAYYSTLVNTFNWLPFYKNLGGFEFFEAVKRQMKSQYDYVLIDSRTGVSDTSGISTIQMPDALIVCFTMNSQSIEGASEVALSVAEQRKSDDPEKQFRVFPLATRLERAEKHKLDVAREAARVRFDTFLTWLDADDRARYWGEVEIFYEPYYAYEEVLAAFADKPGVISSLLSSIERLTSRLTSGKVNSMERLSEAVRLEIVAAFERRAIQSTDPAAHASSVFSRFQSEDAAIARRILLRLINPAAGGSAFRTAVATSQFSAEESSMLRGLIDEGILTRKLPEGGNAKDEYVTLADEALITSWPTLKGWIDEGAGAIRMRSVLKEQADEWVKWGKKPGFLLRGEPLVRARSWNTEFLGVEPPIPEFLRACERQQNLTRWTYFACIVAAVLFTLFMLSILKQNYSH